MENHIFFGGLRMKNVICILLLLISIIRSVSAQSTELKFEHLTIEDGLSQVCINAILQDSKGYMWFATQDGLNKYDGYSFTTYKPSATDENSIRNNVIKTLYEDVEGNIWLGTAGGGLSCFNTTTEEFTNYQHDPFDRSSLSSDDVYAVYQDADSIFWIGTFGGGLNRFDKRTGVFTAYKHSPYDKNSISGNTIRAICEDDNGNLWIGVDEGGLNLFDRKSEIFTKYRHDPDVKNSICSDVVLTIYKDSGGQLWIGTYGGGFDIFDPISRTFVHNENIAGENSLSNNIVWAFCQVEDNEMWIGTRGGGMNIFDIKSGRFANYTKVAEDDMSISGNNVLEIYKDRAGIVWIGTEVNGLNKVDSKRKPFNVIKKRTGQTLSNNNVMAFVEDQNGNIWLGTRGGGINLIDKNNRVKPIFQEQAIKAGYENILSMVFDKDGFLWLGTDGNGFFKIDRHTGEVIRNFRFDPNDKNSLSNNAVTALYVDSDNVLWIGTYGGGLNKYDIEKERFRNFPIDHSNFMRNVVWNIYEDKSGILWVGTGGRGLMRIDKKTERYIYFEHIHNDPGSISNNVVLSILEVRNGDIWVGTGGGGLNRFDREQGRFTALTEEEGLSNDMVLGIVEDNNGNLWLSTYNGISQYNPSTEEFITYYESDGLSDNIFNERACLRNSKGELFFGSVNGITCFSPDSIKTSDYLPPVIFTDLKIFNKSVKINKEIEGETILTKSIADIDKIELSYKLNVFSIEFSALHYLAPEDNMYKYKMVGFDEDWNYTDASKRFATYTNLNGGDYTFMVMASNSDGKWNEQPPTKLHIKIIPPFWKRSWFYSLIIIILLIMVYLFIKIREKQLINEKNRLELMVEERTMEINQQKEELRLQGDLLIKNNEDLSRSNSLLRDSISYAKRIQDAVLPSEDIIKSYLDDFFIFFKPKDIVSGDFYWCSERDGKIYIAVSDCTGHGVPGAFMSMIGTTLLNEIILDKETDAPAEILSKLNLGVIKALNQNATTTDSQDDGMDITVCCIDREKNQVEIACANHTVYIDINGEQRVIEGDISSIGGLFSGEQDGVYTNHVIAVEKGMRIFMFSDGFQDQFGGKRNKKFLASRFKELLYSYAEPGMSGYINLLESTFTEWKGKNKQVDDVLVLGFRL